MPSLTLTITNPLSHITDQLLTVSFVDQGGTLGRSQTNDWVLHDPSRFISSQHAAISFQDNQFYITDLSSNGVYVNTEDSPLGKGNTSSLDHVHTLFIGELSISLDLAAQENNLLKPDDNDTFLGSTNFSASNVPPLQPAPQPIAADHPPLKADDFLSEYEHQDPLALLDPDNSNLNSGADLPVDLFNDAINQAPIASQSSENILAQEYSPTPQIEDAFIAPQARRVTPETSQTIPENWDQTHFEPVSILNAVNKDLPASPSVRQQPPSETPPASIKPHPLPPHQIPSPSTHAAEPLKNKPATHANPSPAATTQYPQAKAAFEANGIDASLLDDPDLVDQSLALLPEMLKGLMATLRSRAEIKNHLRASRTMLQPTENNPIKFSVGLQDAMNNLLIHQRAGFLGPTESIQRAFEDVTQHEAALIAGIQSGLNGMLDKLAPENLEKQVEMQPSSKSLFGQISPAKKWQHYEQTYQRITEDSQSSFVDMFGDEFLEGYETFIINHKPNGK